MPDFALDSFQALLYPGLSRSHGHPIVVLKSHCRECRSDCPAILAVDLPSPPEASHITH
jgi:hypothetical protein